MRTSLVSATLLLLAVAASGCTNSGSDTAPAEAPRQLSEAIQGGKNDGNAHPSVVGITVNFSAICSGALIAPNLVLTARHCVASPPEQINCATAQFPSQPVGAGSVYVTTNANMMTTPPDAYIRGTKLFTPKPTAVCGNDIALVVLEQNINNVPLVSPNLDTARFLEHTGGFGHTYTAIGYGLNAAKSAPDSSGVRRILDHISVGCVPGDTTASLDCDKIPQLQGAYATPEFLGGSGTCQGDSGSSALEQRAINQGELVSLGVLSRGGADGDTCVGSFYTRTDSWKDLILEALNYAQPIGGYPTPAWASGGGSSTSASTSASSSASTGGGMMTGQMLGDTCTAPTDCASNACATKPGGGGSVCTQVCDAANPCPSGFTCNAKGLCFDSSTTIPRGEQMMGETTGCATSHGTSNSRTGAATLVGLGLAFVATRRRRVRRA